MLNKNHLNELKKIAEAKKMSVSELVRLFLDEKIPEEKEDLLEKAPSAQEVLLQMKAQGAKGLKGTDYDKYAYGL